MSKEPMSEERFNWLREYLAPLPRNVAPLTQECLDEIDRLRAENEEAWDRAKAAECELAHWKEGIAAAEEAEREESKRLREENDKLRAELEHTKWNLDKAGLVIAQQCAKLGNQDRKLEKLRAARKPPPSSSA